MKSIPRDVSLADRWLVPTVMFFAAVLVTLGAVLSQSSVYAQNCWRGTACTGPAQPAFPGEWERYNYSPLSRFVRPTRILRPDTSFLANFPGSALLKGNGSQLIFDFGKEVGGVVTITYSASGSGSLGLAFTEAKNWTGEWSDSSNGSFNPDGALYANIIATAHSNYTMPDAKMRGGLRYLTLFALASNNSPIDIDLLDITLDISFQPAWPNLQAYGGYFYSNDDLLNKIWWSGAYTLQTNAIPPSSGRAFPILGSGWLNDANLDLDSSGSTIYVDGSKRDRSVWSGDLAIAVPSILVSTGDDDGVKNGLQVLYNGQQETGELPFCGPGMNIYGSDTYHMAVMIGTYDYYLHTGDDSFLLGIWSKYLSAMSFITAKIDSTGLLDVTGTNDWGRVNQGGHNTEANMLMYKTLMTGSSLSIWMGDLAMASKWTFIAAVLKSAVNNPSLNWDASVGAFKDTATDGSIHPQDGNSMALVFRAANDSYVQSISKQLTTNWGPIGAVCPELPGNLVGFTQSFEVKGHFAARQSTRALDLIRLAWGWYLNNPYGTNSTCIEGYLSDGTFGYRSRYGYAGDYAYTSHAHGWSTGPTEALTFSIVGLQLTGPGGKTWTLSPQFGDLKHAEGGFTTPLGTFSASWTLIGGGYTLAYTIPGGTSGTLVLPAAPGQQPSVQDGNSKVLIAGQYDNSAGTYTIKGQSGSHTLKVNY